MAFKEQLEKMKQKRKDGSVKTSIINYFRENFDGMVEVVAMCRSSKNEEENDDGAYAAISSMCFSDGISSAKLEKISVKLVALYLHRIKDEKGLTKGKKKILVAPAVAVNLTVAPKPVVEPSVATSPRKPILETSSHSELKLKTLDELKAEGWNRKKINVIIGEAYEKYRYGKIIQQWTQDLEDAFCYLRLKNLDGSFQILYEVSHQELYEGLKFGNLYEFLKNHNKL
jgi:hypothetical protein